LGRRQIDPGAFQPHSERWARARDSTTSDGPQGGDRREDDFIRRKGAAAAPKPRQEKGTAGPGSDGHPEDEVNKVYGPIRRGKARSVREKSQGPPAETSGRDYWLEKRGSLRGE